MNTLSAAAARRVRLIGLDVDGVLTDNGVFIGPVVWLSGRNSEATTLRAEEMRVEELVQVPGPRKAAAFAELLKRRGAAAHVTSAAGGHGAVREIVEAILRARGDWSEILARYFMEQTAGAA